MNRKHLNKTLIAALLVAVVAVPLALAGVFRDVSEFYNRVVFHGSKVEFNANQIYIADVAMTNTAATLNQVATSVASNRAVNAALANLLVTTNLNVLGDTALTGTLTASNITASGTETINQLTAANVVTTRLLTATGTITATNINASGALDVTGPLTAGSLNGTNLIAGSVPLTKLATAGTATTNGLVFLVLDGTVTNYVWIPITNGIVRTVTRL